MSGGGWLAQTSFQALLVGVAAQTQPSESVTDLLSAFDSLVSTSGSGWLAASMIYSEEWVKWMDRMKAATAAGNVESLSTSFNDNYIRGVEKTLGLCSIPDTVSYFLKLVAKMLAWGYTSWPSASEEPSATVAYYQEVAETLASLNSTEARSLIPGLDDLILSSRQACQYFSGDWDDSVAKFMEGSASIVKDDPLGTQVLAWSAGKTWLATVSLAARSMVTSFYPFTDNNYVSYAGPKSLMYQPVGTHPQYIPAKFSWKLGSEYGQSAPYSFCAGDDCLGVSFSYNIKGSPSGGEAALGPAFETAYTGPSGKLPIVSVIAASSAFDAYTDVARSRKEGILAVTGEAAVWAAAAGSGTAFEVGSSVRASIQGLPVGAQPQAASAAALHPLLDGGGTDMTGIASAIVAGSRKIVSLQLASRAGVPNDFGIFDPEGQFGAGSFFADQTQESMMADFSTALQDPASTINASVISPVSGLMHIVAFKKVFVTIENANFGIKAGEEVEVDFVLVGTTGVKSGPQPPASTMQKYGVLLQEVVALLQAYPAFAEKLRVILKGGLKG